MLKRILVASILVLFLVLLAACGAPGEQAAAPSSEVGQQAGFETPEQAADLMLEGWAQQAAIPYRNPRYEVLSTDGAFAEVGITAEIRESADQAWMANHAVVECRNINTNWQCVGAIDFDIVDPVITSIPTEQVIVSPASTPTSVPAAVDAQSTETSTGEKSLAEMLVGEWFCERDESGRSAVTWFFLPDGRSFDVFTGGFCSYHVIEEEKKVSMACEDWSEEYLVLEVSESSLTMTDSWDTLTFERIEHSFLDIDIQQLDGLWRLTPEEINVAGVVEDKSEENLDWLEWELFIVGEQTTLMPGWGACGNELILGDTLLCSDQDPGAGIDHVSIQIQELGDSVIRQVFIFHEFRIISSGVRVNEDEVLAKQLVGVWTQSEKDHVVGQFNSDGTFVFSNDGRGTYRVFENGFLSMYFADQEPGWRWNWFECDFLDQNTLRMGLMGLEAQIYKRQVK
jgi:hypothetical protein